MTDTFDASELAASVRSGRSRAVDAVEQSLERIDAHDTNAIVTVCAEAARADAARVDAALAAGDDPGPLAGVPFTVKDTLATAGVRATAGSLLFANHVPVTDATVVSRLRAAGAILVGKTNCPEFALQARTDNRLFGATTHPHDPASSPGGSSGGCAAAVATGLVSFSIGGDYGGSVRYPASCTGIYGLRPAYLSVPTDGHVPSPGAGTPRERFQTVGPLTRSARDIDLVFEVIAERPRAAAPAATGTGAFPIGVVRGGWSCVDAVGEAVAAAAARAADAGFDVVDVDPGPFLEAAALYAAWRASDEYADLRALAKGRESELTAHIRNLLGATPEPLPPDLGERFAAVVGTVAKLLASTPVIVLPIARVGVLATDETTIEIDGRSEPVDALQILAPSRAVSVLGLPALAIPAGRDERGFPIGVQLVGAAGCERQLVEGAGRLR